MVRNLKREELLGLLSSKNLSGKDLSVETAKADKGSFPYWMKFLQVFLLRFIIWNAFVLAAYSGNIIRTGGVYSSLYDLLMQGLLGCFHWIVLDFVWCVLCYKAYAYNPRNMSFTVCVEKDTWKRCAQRQFNYFMWSILPLSVAILILVCYVY